MPEEKRNACGITTLNLDHGDQPINRIILQWDRGSASVENPAAFAIMAQLLREGAGNLSGLEISELLDFNGAWLKIEPSEHLLSISLFSLNKTLDKLLPLLRDIILRPTFPETELRAIAERFASQCEVNGRKVGFRAGQLSRVMAFGKNHPLAQITTADDFRSLTRDDIISTYRATIGSGYPLISVAGATADILPSLDSFALDLGQALPGNSPKPAIKPFDAESGKANVTVEGALQSAIRYTIPTIGRPHPDYIDLRFAIMALGGYFGSRLNKNIREEKGYTYGISAALLGYEEGALVEIRSECDPAYTESVVTEIENELRLLASKPMDAKELEAVKSFAMTNLASMLDSPFSIMDHHLTNIHNNIPKDYFSRQIGSLSNLTPERIRQVIQQHIDLSKGAIAIAGPE